jgi:hypothetical protein
VAKTRWLTISHCRLSLLVPAHTGRLADVVMGLIKIPKKQALSNEKDLTQKITPQGNDQATQTKRMTDTNIPKPFIDKLAINLTFQSTEQASATHSVLRPKLPF